MLLLEALGFVWGLRALVFVEFRVFRGFGCGVGYLLGPGSCRDIFRKIMSTVSGPTSVSWSLPWVRFKPGSHVALKPLASRIRV